MNTTKKIICVTCPKGCSLEISLAGETIIQVKPGCKKGNEYAKQELTDPRRMVASTVRVLGGVHPLLPVYTSAPFPKGRILELMGALKSTQINSPVKEGQIIMGNALGTGIDIVASRDM